MDGHLEEQLAKARIEEMHRYRRDIIYSQLRELISDDRMKILDLVNHGLALVDDELDSSPDPLEKIKHLGKIFQKSYEHECVAASTDAEHVVADLGYALKELACAPRWNIKNRAIGKNTYKEVLGFWEIEETNFQRRGKILDKNTLDNITLGIGAFAAAHFLYILDSPRVRYFNDNEFSELSRAYGLAVKLADNLCDFRDDIPKGFVNIPKEEIHHARGIFTKDDTVIQIIPENLALSSEYINYEYHRIEQEFAYADRLMVHAMIRRSIWDKSSKKLYLFGKFCHSWLEQAGEFAAVETLSR